MPPAQPQQADAGSDRQGKAMTILVLSSLAFSLTNFRGALLRAMKAKGHNVVACAPDRNPAVEARLAEDGVKFVHTPFSRTGTNPFKDLLLLFSYVRLIRRVKPDIVLAYTQKPIVYGGLAARIAGDRPFYALMSGLGHAFSPDTSISPRLRRIIVAIYRAALRRAKAIFVFNSADRADMISFGLVDEGQYIRQVPGSGVDLAHFPACPPRTGSLRFLFIGRLMKNKGVMEFLEAARKVRAAGYEAEFALLGRFEDQNPEGIDAEYCARLASEYDVTFYPETDDVRPFLADCSVFVLPSYYREGLPRTILEAMASARPIITTDMPGCRDAITKGVNGFLVQPRDSDDLADAMLNFAKQPDLAREMGLAARRIAKKSYDVHIVNRLLLDEMGLDRSPRKNSCASRSGSRQTGAQLAPQNG